MVVLGKPGLFVPIGIVVEAKRIPFIIPKINIRVGSIIHLEEIEMEMEGLDKKQRSQAITDFLMLKLRDQLPESLWGVYRSDLPISVHDLTLGIDTDGQVIIFNNQTGKPINI